ncbi:MAG: hydrogenase maturation nickel metallochaperone HypA [Candidatus Fermentibacteraceae bacterium]
MHEYSLAQDMAEVIVSVLGGARRLSTVTVVMGPLSGVSAESLSFCFTEIASAKGLGSPELVVRKTVAEMLCSRCGHAWHSDDFSPGCPACGSWDRRIVSGREFFVESVEFDEEDADEDHITSDDQK